MEDVNRIKLVLVEKKRTSNGWQSSSVLTPRLSASGVRTLPNQTLRVY